MQLGQNRKTLKLISSTARSMKLKKKQILDTKPDPKITKEISTKLVQAKLIQAKLDNFIKTKDLAVSYCIKYNINNKNNKNKSSNYLKKNSNLVYPIHSTAKLFTNILLVLLYSDGIITQAQINEPIKLDSQVLAQLSDEVRTRLKQVSLLQCLKHEAGLKDYLNKYHKELIKCYEKNSAYPNPIEPEDFLQWADSDVESEREIGKRNYNNLGILLAALSMKYHYNNHNVKNNNTGLSYNQILDMYIIKKLKLNLKSFSITKPGKNAIYPTAEDDLTRFVNGTPASGYWVSAADLCKFGEWINKLYNTNGKIRRFISDNELDVFSSKPLKLAHWGFLQTSSAVLETYLDKNITVAVLSNHKDDAHRLGRQLHVLFGV